MTLASIPERRMAVATEMRRRLDDLVAAQVGWERTMALDALTRLLLLLGDLEAEAMRLEMRSRIITTPQDAPQGPASAARQSSATQGAASGPGPITSRDSGIEGEP